MIEKINESEIEEKSRQSRTGKYGLSRKDISGALETEGQPFEVEWVRLPPGKTNFPSHAHRVQWEFYIVLHGQGTVRRNDHTFEVGAGDAFVQPPGTAHQIRNTSATEDLIYYVIADNPVSDPVYYPDSDNLIEKYSQKGRIVTNPLTGGQAELFDEHFTPIDILSDFRYAIVLLRKNKKNLVQAQDILKTFPLTLSVTKNELQIERDKILEVIGKIKSALEFRLAEGVINDE